MESKYYCQICKCSFARKYLYKIHLDSLKHFLRTNNKEELFQCDCGKYYKNKKSIQFHKKRAICIPIRQSITESESSIALSSPPE